MLKFLCYLTTCACVICDSGLSFYVYMVCWSQVKNLLTVHPEDEMPVKNVTIRRIPRSIFIAEIACLLKLITIEELPFHPFWWFLYGHRVPETMPLYDILNEFQKGHSHMAVVVRQSNKRGDHSADNSNRDSKFMFSIVHRQWTALAVNWS